MTTATARAASRIELRATDEIKELLTTAAAYTGIDLTSFVLANVVPVAREIVEQKDRLIVSATEYKSVLEYLDNPTEPPAGLIEAIKSLSKGHGIRSDHANDHKKTRRTRVSMRKT